MRHHAHRATTPTASTASDSHTDNPRDNASRLHDGGAALANLRLATIHKSLRLNQRTPSPKATSRYNPA
jgi:hypothetical protein